MVKIVQPEEFWDKVNDAVAIAYRPGAGCQFMQVTFQDMQERYWWFEVRVDPVMGCIVNAPIKARQVKPINVTCRTWEFLDARND